MSVVLSSTDHQVVYVTNIVTSQSLVSTLKRENKEALRSILSVMKSQYALMLGHVFLSVLFTVACSLLQQPYDYLMSTYLIMESALDEESRLIVLSHTLPPRHSLASTAPPTPSQMSNSTPITSFVADRAPQTPYSLAKAVPSQQVSSILLLQRLLCVYAWVVAHLLLPYLQFF